MVYLKRMSTWTFFLTAFLTPLFFFLISSNLFAGTRLLFFLLVTAAFLALWGWKNFLEKGFVFAKVKSLPFLISLLVLIIISTFSIPTPGGIFDAATGTAGMILAGGVMFLAMLTVAREENARHAAVGLSLAALFLAVCAALATAGVVNKVLPVAVFSQTDFVRGENGVYLLVFFVVTAVLAFTSLVKKDMKVWGIVGMIAGVVGLSLMVTSLARAENRPVLLPFGAAWTMTIEIYKNFRNLILGTGFNQFGIYSSLLRMGDLNSDKFVSLSFPETANTYFEILNSVGILGFALFVLIFVYLFKSLRQFIATYDLSESNLAQVPWSMLYFFPLFSLLIIFFFLPLNHLLIFLLFFILAFASLHFRAEKKLNITTGDQGFLSIQSLQQNERATGNVAPKIFAGLVGVILLVVFWKVIFVVMGEMNYFRGLQAIAGNRGNEAYEAVNAAVGASPNRDGYYLILSQVNFQLALSLNAKKDLSERDRQNIAILVNQAVASAQRATVINPNHVANWENLAAIYEGIINTDSTAKNLAANAFIRAVSLDPRRPTLRVRFAQFLYAVKAYRDAIGQLNQAIILKSDYVNAYYNLGLNYIQLVQADNAKKAFQMALNLVKAGSEDEKLLKKQIENVDADVEAIQAAISPTPTPEAVKTEGTKLTEPQPQPEKLNNMKKDLLQLNQLTPTQVPSLTPTVTPTP